MFRRSRGDVQRCLVLMKTIRMNGGKLTMWSASRGWWWEYRNRSQYAEGRTLRRKDAVKTAERFSGSVAPTIYRERHAGKLASHALTL